MKKIILATLITAISPMVNAQMLIPEFEAATKMEALSSNDDELMPIPYNNGENFYFFRTYANKKGDVFGANIWYAVKKDGKWEKPYKLFRVDDIVGNNQIIGCSRDGNRVYLHNKVQTEVDKKLQETQRLIYLDKKKKQSDRDPDEWTEPKEIIIPNFEFKNLFYNFHMNYDGDVLMVAMSESESHLQQDLFVTTKGDDGKWSELIHLGDRINTRKDETAPYMAEDEKTLYFSSDGHDGLGGLDVFVSYRIGDGWDNWTRPLNLGTPINSEEQDAYFILGDSMDIYFSSIRGDNKNDIHMNIYQTRATGQFKFANQEAKFDYAKLPAEGLTIKIYDIDGTFIDEVKTDEYGNFTFKKLEGDEFYLFKVDEIDDEDFVGSKVYFVNESGEKTKRFIYTEEGELANSDGIIATKHVKGQFNYKELPMKATALVVLDENGFPIDTIYTDENGKFDYKLLAYDTKFSILPINLTDEELGDLSMFMENNEGQNLQNGYFDGTKFKFRRLTADGVDLAQSEPLEDGMVEFFGRFDYQSLPMANTALVVMDENGLPIDTIYTDAFGNFSYKKLAGDKDFSITPLDLTDVGYDELSLVLANGNGTVVQSGLFDGSKFKFTKLNRDDFELKADPIAEDQGVVELQGRFDYKQLPMSKVALLVLDEDGFPIDTIYTDESGVFNYKKLAGDKEFTIIPLDLTDEEFKDLSMALIGQGGKVIEEGNLEGKGFTFEGKGMPIMAVAEKLPQIKEEPKKMVETKATEIKKDEPVAESTPRGNAKLIVYFDFAVNDISEAGKSNLDNLISEIKGSKILLVGHTDNVGSVQNNERRGLDRANSVKKYLASKGIAIEGISVESKGETAPANSNNNPEGRAKNRRVELIVK